MWRRVSSSVLPDGKQRLLSPALQSMRIRASSPTLMTPGPALSPATGSNGRRTEGHLSLTHASTRQTSGRLGQFSCPHALRVESSVP